MPVNGWWADRTNAMRRRGCGRSRLSANLLSTSQSQAPRSIEVRRRLARNEPLYHVDTEGLCALRPDLVIAQSHCEVCAVTPGDVKRNGDLPPETRVLPLSAGTLDEIFASIGC